MTTTTQEVRRWGALCGGACLPSSTPGCLCAAAAWMPLDRRATSPLASLSPCAGVALLVPLSPAFLKGWSLFLRGVSRAARGSMQPEDQAVRVMAESLEMDYRAATAGPGDHY